MCGSGVQQPYPVDAVADVARRRSWPGSRLTILADGDPAAYLRAQRTAHMDRMRELTAVQTALPSLLVAGAGGVGLAFTYAVAMGGGSVLPYGALLVPVVVFGACVPAAATSLPLLRRSVRPAELRYA
ncbi:hypothetical protein GCM10027075_03030 [Streptomyces heilongjiangensis]